MLALRGKLGLYRDGDVDRGGVILKSEHRSPHLSVNLHNLTLDCKATLRYRGVSGVLTSIEQFSGEGVVGLSEGPAGPQGGGGALLEKLHPQSSQPLHPVVLGDPSRRRPRLQKRREESVKGCH